MCDGTHACYIIISEGCESMVKTAIDFLETRDLLIGHNIVYDLQVLYKYGMTKEPELFCTMIAHHLLDENSRHGLKELAASVLGATTTKYDEIEDHSSAEFISYAINDAVWTWQLASLFRDQLLQEDLVPLFRDIEMPFQYVLRDMKVAGMLVDVDLLRTKRKELELHTDQLYKSLVQEAGVSGSFNFNSSKQLGELLFTTLGLPIQDVTPSGAPSVGSAALVKLKSHPIVSKILEYKNLRKLLTSYFAENAQILSNIDPDNRVRPSFLDFGTKTGRLSCNSPNLQQLPKESKDPVGTRSCFIVPKGYKMITCDYSGQEVAVAAQQSKDPTLVDALNKGQDMHLRIANQFYNLGIPDEALFKTHPDYDTYKDKYYNERNQAKVITFGLFYGKGAYGFAKDFDISEEEAQEIVDKYFEGMPQLKEAIEHAHDQVKAHGYVSSMSGRRRRFEQMTNRFGEKYYNNMSLRQSFNFLIQGYSADMIRMAMTAVRHVSKEYPQWDLKAIATVHDEAVYEVKEEYTDVAAQAIKKAFESVTEFVVPIVADIGIGKDYGEAK